MVEKVRPNTNDLENRLATAEKSTYDVEQRVENLEFDHDTLYQCTRKFNVEVHGIPECEGENLTEIITKVGQNISVYMSDNDIDVVHSPGLYRKPPAKKPVIVRFTSYKEKRYFYKGKFNLKDTNLSGILGSTLSDSQTRIFINENLTHRRQELLAMVRNMKRAQKLNRVWTVDGKQRIPALGLAKFGFLMSWLMSWLTRHLLMNELPVMGSLLIRKGFLDRQGGKHCKSL